SPPGGETAGTARARRRDHGHGGRPGFPPRRSQDWARAFLPPAPRLEAVAASGRRLQPTARMGRDRNSPIQRSKDTAMAITLAGVCFEYVVYDERGDTLFLSVEPPNESLPEEGYETPEGHFVVFDDNGALVSIEYLNPRWLLERDGELRLTLPTR